MTTGPSTTDLAHEFFDIATRTGRVPGALCGPSPRIGLAPPGSETGARVTPQECPGDRRLEVGETTHWRLSDTEHAFLARVDGDVTRTVAAVVEVGARGVVRYLELRTSRESALVPATSDHPTRSATPATRRYLERLDSGDPQGAAQVFSQDAVYSHPPYVDDPARTSIVTGRDGLRQAFTGRGRKAFSHDVLRDGTNALGTVVEGVVPEVRGTFGSFVSFVQVTPDDEISRYMAFYCEPGLR